MRQRLKPLAISLCVLGFVSTPVLADTTDKNVSSRTASLEQQVAELQQEVAAMKGQKVSQQKKSSKSRLQQTAATTISSKKVHSSSAPSVGSLPNEGLSYLPIDVDVPGQSFVSSGPYIGIPLEYSGGNLIINAPSVNQDVALLKVRKNIHQRLEALGVHEEADHAHVLLSGIVEGQGVYQTIKGASPNSSIDLTSAGLDAYILGPSNWLSSLISLSYDNNTGASEGSLSSNSRTANSRVFVNQAFVTIGDLRVTPVYGTFGQLNVPFGTYSSNMVTSPMTKIMARTKTRAIVLGYRPQVDNTMYAASYIFQGDSTAGPASRVNNGGIDLGYQFNQGQFTGDIGGGVIANLADSQGMQFVGNSATNFNGFGGINGTGNEKLVHRVPAYDLRGMAQIGKNIDLLAEYITASTNFSKADMTMNNHGAKPRALNTEAAYTFSAFARPSSVAVGYGMTKDALAIGLPAQRYSMVFNTSIWRDTLQSLEFRHDINYSGSNRATGSSVAAAAPVGSNDNAVTAQFDVYF